MKLPVISINFVSVYKLIYSLFKKKPKNTPLFMTGKLPAKFDPKGRTLKMAKYMVNLPDPPKNYFPFDLNKVAELFPMDANDRLGCCVVAGAAHYMTNAHLRIGQKMIPEEKDVISIYRKLSGCRDKGLVMFDFMKYWRKHPLFGHEIEAFGRVDLHNHKLIKQCIHLFGGIDLGFLVQDNAISDFESDTPWTPGSSTGSGHCVIAAAYDENYYYILTWGGCIRATKEWWDAQCDEAFVILPPEYKEPGFAPGFDNVQLQNDFMNVITN
jgi:hypothetical protein